VDEFFQKVPITLKLGCLSFVLSSIVGISLGILSAVKQYSFADTFSTLVSILLASIPGFFLGMVLIYVFGLKIGILPTHGIDEWKSYILPVITLAAGGSAQLMRLTRTTMLEAIRQDYMRTAKAKGCTPAKMIWKHALKNAILPVLTVMGTSFGSILGGAVICETVFAIPGLGNYILSAIRNKDIPVVMSSTVFLSTFFCLVMVVVDILYAIIDPRIRDRVVR
jgi:peptide/nickel transport system permease protein